VATVQIDGDRESCNHHTIDTESLAMQTTQAKCNTRLHSRTLAHSASLHKYEWTFLPGQGQESAKVLHRCLKPGAMISKPHRNPAVVERLWHPAYMMNRSRFHLGCLTNMMLQTAALSNLVKQLRRRLNLARGDKLFAQ